MVSTELYDIHFGADVDTYEESMRHRLLICDADAMGTESRLWRHCEPKYALCAVFYVHVYSSPSSLLSNDMLDLVSRTYVVEINE
jgi:hypothetical protein